jgi:hypothetical protein
VDRSAWLSASSRHQEFHGDQGTMLDPGLYIVIDTALLMNGRDDRPPSGLIQNGRRPGGQVRLYALFEVGGELGVRQEVGIPGAASWGSPRDVDLPLDSMEPYLDAARASTAAHHLVCVLIACCCHVTRQASGITPAAKICPIAQRNHAKGNHPHYQTPHLRRGLLGLHRTVQVPLPHHLHRGPSMPLCTHTVHM